MSLPDPSKPQEWARRLRLSGGAWAVLALAAGALPWLTIVAGMLWPMTGP